MNFMRNKQIILLIIFLCFSVAVYFFRDSAVVSSVTSFFQKSISSTRAMIFSSGVDENTDLAKENLELNEKLAELEIIERENIALKSQFEENISGSYTLMPARIVGYRGRGAYESFVIDAGVKDKVKDGMAVISGNTLVGTIYKTSQNISEVRTILHPEFSTIVKYPPTNARGIIRGFDEYLVMENVLISDTLERDGIVVTVGELNNTGIGIPSDLSVGKIDSVDRVETDAFQAAQVKPLIDYSQISNVFVILSL